MLLVIVIGFLMQYGAGENLARIYKGNEAFRGQFPYAVYIHYPRHYCSGTIISRKWVLTAGHCINPKISPEQHRIYAGNVEYNFDELPKSGQIRKGKNMIVHPDYQLFNATNFTDIGSFNDLGLIEVNKPFKFNKYVNKATVSSKSAFGIHNCKAIGFGRSEWGDDTTLRFLNVRKIVRCKDVKDAELKELYPNDLYLCSYPKNDDSALLGGDSGGPMVCPGDNVVGVAFWGKAEDGSFVMLHTTTASFYKWITTNARL